MVLEVYKYILLMDTYSQSTCRLMYVTPLSYSAETILADLKQTNPNPEPLSGVPTSIPLRLHLLYLILHGIQRGTRQHFVKCVKINCSDFVQGGEESSYRSETLADRIPGLDEGQATEIVRLIVSWNIVDILEISGGTYENPGRQTSLAS